MSLYIHICIYTYILAHDDTFTYGWPNHLSHLLSPFSFHRSCLPPFRLFNVDNVGMCRSKITISKNISNTEEGGRGASSCIFLFTYLYFRIVAYIIRSTVHLKIGFLEPMIAFLRLPRHVSGLWTTIHRPKTCNGKRNAKLEQGHKNANTNINKESETQARPQPQTGPYKSPAFYFKWSSSIFVVLELTCHYDYDVPQIQMCHGVWGHPHRNWPPPPPRGLRPLAPQCATVAAAVGPGAVRRESE